MHSNSRSLSHISNEDLRDETAVKDGTWHESKRMSVPQAQSSRNLKMMAQTQPQFAIGVSSGEQLEHGNKSSAMGPQTAKNKGSRIGSRRGQTSTAR